MGSLDLAFEGELDELVLDSITQKLDGVVDGSQLVIDFAVVTFCGSQCMKVMVTARNRLRQSGGSLIITNATDNVRRAFRVAQLEELLESG